MNDRFLVRFASDQIVREFLHGGASADLGDGLLARYRRFVRIPDGSAVGNLGKIPFANRPVFFDRRQFGHFVLKFFQRSFDLAVIDTGRTLLSTGMPS